jgi:hypothetical protein
VIRTTVIVEGNRLDLLQDIATDFTYSIQDIREPDSRRTDFSKTIELPGTPKNNALFAQLFDINIENDWTPNQPNIGYNFNPNKSAKALVLVDGIEVFRGVIRILKGRVKQGVVTYEASVIGRLADILFALGDKKLSDIDFSDLDHVLDVAHLQRVWNNPQDYRYSYPLIDYGFSLDNVNYNIQSLAPAIYVKEYIDRMFAAAGFTYNCPFFSQPYFQSLIVPVTTKYDVGSPARDVKYLEVKSVTNSQENNRSGNNWREVTIPFRTSVVDKYGWHPWTMHHIQITAPIDVSFQFNVNFRYNNSKGRGAELFVIKNDNQNARLVVESIPANAQFEKIIEIPKQHYNAGDTLYISVNMPPKGRVYWTGQDTWLAPSPTDDSQYPIDVGSQVRIFDTLAQDTAQKDFFKSILLMHNLYLFTDESNDKNLFIVPQAWFYNTFAGDAVDWTYKQDYSQEAEVIPMGELAASEYLLTYKKDTDYYNDQRYFKIYGEVYGQRKSIVDNDFEKSTKKIEVIFSPTPPVNIEGSTRVIPHIYKVNKDEIKERDAFNIRILQYGGLKPSKVNSSPNSPFAPWNITDFNGNFLQSFNYYPYAGMWDDPVALSRDLCFGPPKETFYYTNPYPDVTLYRYWWEGLINEITNKDSKLLRAYFNLSAIDINQLDFKRLVKVDNTYFKLNKVAQYNPLAKQMTRVELFKSTVRVEVERPGFLKWSDDGYLLHSDESTARIPYA